MKITKEYILVMISIIILLISMILLKERAEAVQQCNNYWIKQLENKTIIPKQTGIQLEVYYETANISSYNNNNNTTRTSQTN